MNRSELCLEKRFRNAQFVTSATRLDQCPSPTGIELAFVGRSNVGKSSVINSLCHQKNLARTSKTPGRTQLINFFVLDDHCSLVDLPGYGYAKVSQQQQKHWQREVTNFLQHRESLAGLILITDIRHQLKPTDEQLIALAAELQLPLHIVLNKADKLSQNKAKQALFQCRDQLKPFESALAEPLFSAQTFSASKAQGRTEFYNTARQRWNP